MLTLNPFLKIFKFALLGQMFIRSFFFIYDRKDADPQVVVQNGNKRAISVPMMCASC